MKKIIYGRIAFLLLSFFIAQFVSAQFRVIGYVTSWSGSVSAIQFDKLTHVNYAFLLPTNTGGIQAIDNPSKLQSLVSAAHANGVKVMISVGGWNDGNDSGFEGLAANGTYRTNFVNNMISFVNQYGLDGVDIDWEYPDDGASANNYVALMTQLSNEMHSRGKLLTAAVVGTGGNSILSSVFNVVDFLNLMAYDFNNFDHSTYNYATQSINYWKGRGLPANKCVLGVPFYGRPSWETYAQLVARGADPYADVFQGVGYNGITTIKNKTNLAFDQGSGIMIWELSGDVTGANSLVSAIHEVVLTRGGGNPGTGVATFYKDCNYGGAAVALQPGSYTMSQLQAKGILNDDISSLKVQSGYKVTLYWDDNFTGTTLVKTADDDCLVDDGWNDKVTSLVVGTNTGGGNEILIQAENYNNMLGVQTEATTDAGGGLNVGYIDATDWMAYYNINFPTTGTYKVEYRVASLSGGGRLSLDLNAGSVVLGALDVPSTGGWQNWTTISHTVTVNAGTYNLGVYAVAGGWNLNWIRITPVSGVRTTQQMLVNAMIDNSLNAGVAFNIAPNPVLNQLTINTNEDLTGGIIRIFDISGKQVMTARQATKRVDVSSLARGVYTLVYTKNEKKIIKQFIK
jgi:hypothetical protein